jgi:predicted DNA-binding transcriptional regulator YafY
MAKKRQAAPSAEPPGVTTERFTRLYRLVKFLGAGPATRETLARRLRLDVRGFYRDLELLRAAGIDVSVTGGRYSLTAGGAAALARLPFPDPHLSLGEAQALAKGRSAAHRKLAELVGRLTP